MNKWYRSAPCKGILIVVEHCLIAVIITCLIWGLLYPGGEYGKALLDTADKNYADTAGFGKSIQEAGMEVLLDIQHSRNFETDGVYDENKIVDLKRYMTDGIIDGVNASKLSYKLGDIINLYGDADFSGDLIVVCKKPDDTYQYYHIDEFKSLVNQSELFFVEQGGGIQQDAVYYLRQLDSVTSVNMGNDAVNIQNKNGDVLYTEYWSMRTEIKDTIKTVDGTDLVSLANEKESWNGRLKEAYAALHHAVTVIPEEVNRYKNQHQKWSEGNTNLSYIFVDLDQRTVYTNRSSYQSFDGLQKNLELMAEQGKYVIVAPKLVDFKSNIKIEASYWRDMVKKYGGKIVEDNYIFALGVNTNYPIQDTFYAQNRFYKEYAPWMGVILTCGILAALMFVIILIWLTVIAGRTREDGELRLFWFDRIKTEFGFTVIAILVSGAVLCATVGISYLIRDINTYLDFYSGQSFSTAVLSALVTSEAISSLMMRVAFMVACMVASFALILTGYLSFVRRLKAKSIWSNSILRWMFKELRQTWRHRGVAFKAMMSYLAFMFLHWLVLTSQSGGFMMLLSILDVVVFIYIVRNAIAKQKISQGIQKIAGGNVDYNIPLEGLKGDNLDMAAHINNIGGGLNAAVEENLKNERLKTDLITNVSHDIKTPLTSIINYVDLLKRENIENEKVQGYLDILETKSQRLKTLTEDVVEASKISSGNIKLELMNLNLTELVNQTEGEFNEKFEARDVTIVNNLSSEPAMIYADGRRMWRVLANIFNNAAKYAMEGSRVYADLTVTSRNVILSLKNVSQQPLNISADELTERFIRGDVSRSTEGSGLGLSIAKNLTELQGGEFNLYLDGDLFKVTIVFPKTCQRADTENETRNEKVIPS